MLRRLPVFCCCFDFKILLYLFSFCSFSSIVFSLIYFFKIVDIKGNIYFGTVDIMGIDILAQ